METLRAGDPVLTWSGETHALKWAGSREIHCHARREIWPIRVIAGALGPASPEADLYLSPDHALYLDDVLVPVKYLINGTTVAHVAMDLVTYHHLELAHHDIVVADGAAAETYLDTGDRGKFDGQEIAPMTRAEAWTMREAALFAPLVIAGPILAAIRFRLADRAEQLTKHSPTPLAA